MEKKQLLRGIPCVILFAVLINGRLLDIYCIIGSLTLSIIFSTVLFYTIEKTIQNSEKNRSKYLWLFLSLFSFFVFIVSLLKPEIGWDTWQVYDMSKYVSSDFGYMDQIRQHILFSHYEMAFPPVFPYLMFLVNCIYDLGVYSSVYLNAIFVLLCFVELSKIFKIKKIETIGCITTSIIFCGKLFVLTYKLGLTQPLGYYLLILLCRFILCEEKYDFTFAIKSGICCGLLLMNRFDALSIVVVMFLAIPLLMHKQFDRRKIVKNMLIYSVAVILICSPWIIYSFFHFNSFFITDNGRRLFNIPDTRPSTFFPENSPALTIRDSFVMWFVAFMGRALHALCSLCIGLIIYSIVVEILAGSYIIFHKKVIHSINVKLDKKVLVILAIIIGQEALFIMTGYSDIRYHLPLIFILQLLSIYYFSLLAKNNKWKKTTIIGVSCLSILAYAKIGYVTNPINAVEAFISGEGYHTNLVLNEQEQDIKEYLSADCNTICFYRSENEFDFLKFSAESQISNIISPSNLSTENVLQFVDTFEINYLYSSNKQVVDIFNSKLKLFSTPFDNLYKIEGKSD